MENKPSFEPLEIGSYVSADEVKERVSKALESGLEVKLSLGSMHFFLRCPEEGKPIGLIPDKPAYPVSIKIFDRITSIQEIHYIPGGIYKVIF